MRRMCKFIPVVSLSDGPTKVRPLSRTFKESHYRAALKTNY